MIAYAVTEQGVVTTVLLAGGYRTDKLLSVYRGAVEAEDFQPMLEAGADDSVHPYLL